MQQCYLGQLNVCAMSNTDNTYTFVNKSTAKICYVQKKKKNCTNGQLKIVLFHLCWILLSCETLEVSILLFSCVCLECTRVTNLFFLVHTTLAHPFWLLHSFNTCSLFIHTYICLRARKFIICICYNLNPNFFLLVIRRDLESMTHHPRYT